MVLYCILSNRGYSPPSEFIIPLPCSFVCSVSLHVEHGQYVLSSTHGPFQSKQEMQACSENLQVVPAFTQARLEARNSCSDSARCSQMCSENNKGEI